MQNENRVPHSASAASSALDSAIRQLAITEPSETPRNQWEDCRERIFQLYIVENKALKDVMAVIKEEHGLEASPKKYKTKMVQWGFSKNNRRSEVLAILRQKEEREAIGKDSMFTLRDRPVDLKDIERYQKRNKLHDISKKPLVGLRGQYPKDLVCRTPPPVQRLVPVAQVWRVPEKLLYDIDVYIKGSFESGIWAFNGPERLIESSPSQPDEQKAISSFRSGLETGCATFTAGNPSTAGIYWRSAFREVESLVRGSYHDVVPNLIQKINDLKQGYPELAALLKQHIARCSSALQPSGHARYSIFGGLDGVELNHMQELEELIMRRFVELFERYLGWQCYSSFVMVINSARHRLKRSTSTTFDEVLPKIYILDEIFGPSNRRSLEIFRLRADVQFERGRYLDAQEEATMLILRADLLEGDPWNRLYFMINGWYIRGNAQHSLGDYAAVASSFRNCLVLEEEFGKLGHSYMFNKEKILMWETLEKIASMSNQPHEAARWHSRRVRTVQGLEAVDTTQPIGNE